MHGRIRSPRAPSLPSPPIWPIASDAVLAASSSGAGDLFHQDFDELGIIRRFDFVSKLQRMVHTHKTPHTPATDGIPALPRINRNVRTAG